MRRVWQRLSVWFRADRHHEELAEELRLHVELRETKLCESGMTAEEAHWETHRRFGSMQQVHEECRSVWGVRWLDELRQDVAYAVRTMRQDAAFTIAAVLTLTLGIAANTTIFAFIDALILRPLPVSDPNRLVMLSVHEAVENLDMPASAIRYLSALLSAQGA